MGSIGRGRRSPFMAGFNAAQAAIGGAKGSPVGPAASPAGPPPQPISSTKLGAGSEHTFADGSVAFTTAGGVTIGGAAGTQATAYAKSRNGK